MITCTWHHYPRPPCAPSFIKSRKFPYYQRPKPCGATSDMCTPGRDTQNTERKTWRLRGTDFVGLYLKVSTNSEYKRRKIRMQLLIRNCFWQVSRQTTALTGQGYQYYYDHRSDPTVSQNVCLPLRLWVLFWNILLIRNCTRLDRPRIHISLQSPISDVTYQSTYKQ